jgi:hyperosmotically inducible periplasmic protein
MINMSSCLRIVSIGTVLAITVPIYAFQDQPAKTDNTKMNKRDRKEGAVTADQQKMNAADRELTQNVRKAIMDDKSLSTYAHNVKVVSRDGMVTLKGPVRSAEEKQTVEAKAVEVAGAGKVTNNLTVASKGSKSKTDTGDTSRSREK